MEAEEGGDTEGGGIMNQHRSCPQCGYPRGEEEVEEGWASCVSCSFTFEPNEGLQEPS